MNNFYCIEFDPFVSHFDHAYPFYSYKQRRIIEVKENVVIDEEIIKKFFVSYLSLKTRKLVKEKHIKEFVKYFNFFKLKVYKSPDFVIFNKRRLFSDNYKSFSKKELFI